MGVWDQFLKKKKKNGGMGSIYEKKKKKKLCMQNLTKEWKQPPVAILQQASFYNIFILCFVVKNHQKIWSRYLFNEFSITDIF